MINVVKTANWRGFSVEVELAPTEFGSILIRIMGGDAVKSCGRYTSVAAICYLNSLGVQYDEAIDNLLSVAANFDAAAEAQRKAFDCLDKAFKS